MNKKISKAICLFLIFCCLPLCAKSKKKQAETSAQTAETKPDFPKWLTDEGRLSLFPSSRFISQCAFGKNADDAKSKAAAGISEYVKSSVESVTKSRYEESQKNGAAFESLEVSSDSSVSSANKLYQLEYTTPFFDSKSGTFACTAFIDREKAFLAVKPKLDNGANFFPSEYAKALEENDLFKRISAIHNAQKIMNGFYEVYDFVCAVNPQEAANYKSADSLFVLSSAKLNELKSEATVSVKVQNDSADKVKNKLMEILDKSGFSVIKTGNAKYSLEAAVSFEIQKSADAFLSFPAISLEVQNVQNRENVFSYADTFGKAAGFDKESATRKAYSVICKKLEENLFR